MRVAAVVLNWNGGAANLACLSALVRQGRPPERILFVDNASTDGSCAAVAAAHPSLEILRNGTNLGYGGGNNVGVRRALELGAEAVLVLNNDVELEPEALSALVAELERDPQVGIVGPRVLYRELAGTLWAAGGMLTWRQNLSTLLGHGRLDGPEWKKTREVDYVIGCALLARREVWQEVGGFDDAYFAYTEDLDFGLRAARAGWSSRVVGSVAAYHAASSATGGGYNPRRKYMMAVNSIWFLRQHAGPLQWLSFFAFDVLTLPLIGLAGLFRGRAKAVLAKALGIWDGLLGKRVTAAVLEPGAKWLW